MLYYPLVTSVYPDFINYMTEKTKQKKVRKQPLVALRSFLDTTIKKAHMNPHSGEARSKDLDIELKRIKSRVSETLAKITKESEESDSPDGDLRVQAKLEKTTQILGDEMMLLAAQYHRQKDIATIKHFLNEQRNVINDSLNEGGSDANEQKKVSLDGRIAELHSLMASERKRIKSSTKKERMKFWISISIAIISLSISVLALTLR